MLNKKKKFQVFDMPNAMGAKYQQDNKIFNSKGEEIDHEGNVIESEQMESVENAEEEAVVDEKPKTTPRKAKKPEPLEPLQPLKAS